MAADLAEAEKESRAVRVPARPKPVAVRVAEMAREQKQAFIASIERSLDAPGTSGAERAVLGALLEAAREEVAVIDKQLKNSG